MNTKQLPLTESAPEAFSRRSAIASYPGFNSYLEMCGERMRFVIDAKIENASEVLELLKYIDCIASILKIPHRHRSQDEIDGDWAE